MRQWGWSGKPGSCCSSGSTSNLESELEPQLLPVHCLCPLPHPPVASGLLPSQKPLPPYLPPSTQPLPFPTLISSLCSLCPLLPLTLLQLSLWQAQCLLQPGAQSMHLHGPTVAVMTAQTRALSQGWRHHAAALLQGWAEARVHMFHAPGCSMDGAG